MSEIIPTNNLEPSAENKDNQPELQNLPDSVRELIIKLPDELKNRIVPELSKVDTLLPPDATKRNLEAMVAGFDIKTREEYMAQCLQELFDTGQLKKRLTAEGINTLQSEIERLLDLLWNNRGKYDEVKLYNQEYYNSFFVGREAILSKINAKQAEIDQLQHSIATTIRQRRLTKKKQEELAHYQKEMDLLNADLKKYDAQYRNSDFDCIYFRDVSSRQKKEKEWTQAATVTAEYLDPAEFATVVAEQLDRTFHQEAMIVRGQKEKFIVRTLPKEKLERAEMITAALQRAIDNWYSVHQNEASLKAPFETKTQEKQSKIIEYFMSLAESYQRGKNSNQTDEEMVYTIRQMEVSLHIMGKHFSG